MKNLYAITCLLFLFVLQMPAMLFAQGEILITPDSFESEFQNENISQNFTSFTMASKIDNLTSHTLWVGWKITKGVCNSNWLIGVSDKNNDFFPGTLLAPNSFELLPGEQEAYMGTHVFPMTSPGCCGYLMELFEWENPETVYATINYQVAVNEFGCEFSAINNLNSLTELKVYPNPTRGNLSLESNVAYDAAGIYDQLGQLIHYEKSNGDPLALYSLPAGIYYLVLFSDDSAMARSRFVKF